EVECAGHDRAAFQPAFHRDQRVALAGGFLRGLDAVGIALLVTEAEYVDRAERGADLAAAAGVEEGGQPRAGADGHVMGALRTDLEVLLKLRAVKHRAAAVALLPQPLGHAALACGAALGADAGRHDFLQPGHAFAVILCGLGREPGEFSPLSRRRPHPAPGAAGPGNP